MFTSILWSSFSSDQWINHCILFLLYQGSHGGPNMSSTSVPTIRLGNDGNQAGQLEQTTYMMRTASFEQVLSEAGSKALSPCLQVLYKNAYEGLPSGFLSRSLLSHKIKVHDVSTLHLYLCFKLYAIYVNIHLWVHPPANTILQRTHSSILWPILLVMLLVFHYFQ